MTLAIDNMYISWLCIESKKRQTTFYKNDKQLISGNVAWRTNLKLYKSLIIPVLINSSETWRLNRCDEFQLGSFKHKVFRIDFNENWKGFWRQDTWFEWEKTIQPVKSTERWHGNRDCKFGDAGTSSRQVEETLGRNKHGLCTFCFDYIVKI